MDVPGTMTVRHEFSGPAADTVAAGAPEADGSPLTSTEPGTSPAGAPLLLPLEPIARELDRRARAVRLAELDLRLARLEHLEAVSALRRALDDHARRMGA